MLTKLILLYHFKHKLIIKKGDNKWKNIEWYFN